MYQEWWAVLVWNRVSISTILVRNGVWFVHSSLELGMFFWRISCFFIIWRQDHFGLKYGKGFKKRVAHPHPIFLEVPPGIFVVFGSEMGGDCARRSLRTPWKLGLRIVAWWKPCMFCEESLGKIKFRAFPKRVGPRILASKRWLLWNKWTLLSGRKKIRILISKIAMVGCCKLSLYANESCDEHAIYFRRWLKWRAM